MTTKLQITILIIYPQVLWELLAQMDPLVLTVPVEQSAWNQWLEYSATGATEAAGKYYN